MQYEKSAPREVTSARSKENFRQKNHKNGASFTKGQVLYSNSFILFDDDDPDKEVSGFLVGDDRSKWLAFQATEYGMRQVGKFYPNWHLAYAAITEASS